MGGHFSPGPNLFFFFFFFLKTKLHLQWSDRYVRLVVSNGLTILLAVKTRFPLRHQNPQNWCYLRLKWPLQSSFITLSSVPFDLFHKGLLVVNYKGCRHFAPGSNLFFFFFFFLKTKLHLQWYMRYVRLVVLYGLILFLVAKTGLPLRHQNPKKGGGALANP